MAKHKNRTGRSRYTLVGFAVTKLAMPIAIRMLKRKARVLDTSKRKKKDESSRSGHTGVALGAIIGAAAYLVKRRHDDGHSRLDDD